MFVYKFILCMCALEHISIFSTYHLEPPQFYIIICYQFFPNKSFLLLLFFSWRIQCTRSNSIYISLFLYVSILTLNIRISPLIILIYFQHSLAVYLRLFILLPPFLSPFISSLMSSYHLANFFHFCCCLWQQQQKNWTARYRMRNIYMTSHAWKWTLNNETFLSRSYWMIWIQTNENDNDEDDGDDADI